MCWPMCHISLWSILEKETFLEVFTSTGFGQPYPLPPSVTRLAGHPQTVLYSKHISSLYHFSVHLNQSSNPADWGSISMTSDMSQHLPTTLCRIQEKTISWSKTAIKSWKLWYWNVNIPTINE
jgi:hypothetical protein